MPVENERKYVLAVDEPYAFRDELLARTGARSQRIQQGYVGEHIRFRLSQTASYLRTFNAFMTFKMKVGDELIEIETDMALADFRKLWESDKVERKLIKERICVPHYNNTWEVDFFIEPADVGNGFEKIYMVMAEVELPPGRLLPSSVPKFINDNLIYLVEPNDLRFVNARLGTPDEVRALVASL
jgi:CYTH domain-containing protein